jgi:translation elongation factor P/translation initiation factor 5A
VIAAEMNAAVKESRNNKQNSAGGKHGAANQTNLQRIRGTRTTRNSYKSQDRSIAFLFLSNYEGACAGCAV